MLHRIFFIISIFLISNISFAQEKGHIKPFYNERLTNTISLRCGVSIVENREYVDGKYYNQDLNNEDIKSLNYICDKVLSYYPKFVSDNNLGIISSLLSFSWEVSFLPETRDYRCLNDTTYRFHTRSLVEGDNNAVLDGYTDLDQKHTFVTSNRKSKSYNTVFAHEIFHALNEFYHNKDSEELAGEFTQNLGYGR